MLDNGSKTQHDGQVCLRILQDGKDLVFGANVSQSRAIEELQKPSQPQPFHRMADHLLRIAGEQSRTSEGGYGYMNAMNLSNRFSYRALLQILPQAAYVQGWHTHFQWRMLKLLTAARTHV